MISQDNILWPLTNSLAFVTANCNFEGWTETLRMGNNDIYMKGYTYDNSFWPWITLLCICYCLFEIRRHWYHMTTIYGLGPRSVDFLIVIFLGLNLNLNYGTQKTCIWNELWSYVNISFHCDDYLAFVMILLHFERKTSTLVTG